MAFLLLIIIFLLFILVLCVAFRPHPSGERPQYGPRKSDLKIIAGGLAVFALTLAVNAALGG